jgi:hypothetical protein
MENPSLPNMHVALSHCINLSFAEPMLRRNLRIPRYEVIVKYSQFPCIPQDAFFPNKLQTFSLPYTGFRRFPKNKTIQERWPAH